MSSPEQHAVPAEPPPLPPGHTPPGEPPPLPPRHPIGEGAGSTSLAFSLIAASMLITGPLSLIAALLTRGDMEIGPLGWVAPLVLLSFPALFGLLSVSLGIAAVRGSARGSSSWKAAVSGLWLCGLQVAALLYTTLRDGDLLLF